MSPSENDDPALGENSYLGDRTGTEIVVRYGRVLAETDRDNVLPTPARNIWPRGVGEKPGSTPALAQERNLWPDPFDSPYPEQLRPKLGEDAVCEVRNEQLAAPCVHVTAGTREITVKIEPSAGAEFMVNVNAPYRGRNYHRQTVSVRVTAGQDAATEQVVSGLEPDVEYAVEVWARKGMLYSPESAVSVRTLPDLSPPAAVRLERRTVCSRTVRVQLSWDVRGDAEYLVQRTVQGVDCTSTQDFQVHQQDGVVNAKKKRLFWETTAPRGSALCFAVATVHGQSVGPLSLPVTLNTPVPHGAAE